jgi:ketosteroid isomerase-like protein
VSRENVEVVRQAWEASERHDNETVLSLYDPEVEIDAGFQGRVWRGLDGVRGFFRDWLADWDGHRSEIEQWIDAGDDVVAVLHTYARGKQSGVPVHMRQWHVWTLREGKLWRLRIYTTKEEAFKAVGREE